MVSESELRGRLKELGYDSESMIKSLKESNHYKKVLEEINDVNKLQLMGRGGLYLSESTFAQCPNDWIILTSNQLKIVRYSFGSCDTWILPYRNIVSYKSAASSTLYVQVSGNSKRYRIGIFSQAEKAVNIISNALE